MEQQKKLGKKEIIVLILALIGLLALLIVPILLRNKKNTNGSDVDTTKLSCEELKISGNYFEYKDRDEITNYVGKDASGYLLSLLEKIWEKDGVLENSGDSCTRHIVELRDFKDLSGEGTSSITPLDFTAVVDENEYTVHSYLIVRMDSEVGVLVHSNKTNKDYLTAYPASDNTKVKIQNWAQNTYGYSGELLSL